MKLVIASQPTRGLDVGSIEYIHRRLVEQRDAGAAVLIVSTELDEVLAVGDRVAVMLGGRIVGIVEGPEATRENVGMLMGGAGVRRIGRALEPAVIPILAVVTAFIVGSIFILITDFENLARLGTDPVGAITGALGTIGNAYYSMLIGAIGDPARIGAALSDPTPRAVAAAIRPITETLVAATPPDLLRPGRRRSRSGAACSTSAWRGSSSSARSGPPSRRSPSRTSRRR